MDIRLGFIGIVIDDPDHAAEINHILSRHGQIIAGRMGLPRLHHREVGAQQQITDNGGRQDADGK